MSDPAGTGAADPARVDTQHPWLGLVSFEESNSEFFFGRATEISELERLVMGAPVTVLFGRSGLGKTSLLRAGVFPRLRARNYLPIYVRLSFSDGAPPLVEQVRQALWGGLQSSKIEARPPDPKETLWEYCHRDDVDFWDARVRLITPILVFDQFEEIFTLGKKSHIVQGDTEKFKEELQALINNSPPQQAGDKFKSNPELVEHFDFDKRTVKVLLSLREDYLPDLDALRKQFQGLGQNRMRLEPLTGLQAREIILKPGEGLVDEPVADRIIEFVARDKTRAEDEPLILENRVVEPALLSVVCRELNQRRLDSGQSKITAEILSGAKEEILVKFYDRAMEGISQPVREFVEDKLLTAAGYRDRYALSNAIRIPGVTEKALDELVNRRLLRKEPAKGDTWFELTHDLLTGVVQKSRDQREQRQKEEARLREQREAEEALLRARREAEEDRQALNRAQRTVFVVTTLAIAALVLAVVAFASLIIARQAENSARQEKKFAEEAGELARNKTLEASREDLATAEEMLDEGEWGRGLAYLGHSLYQDPQNSTAAVHLWSAVVYGRRGDGKLPEFLTTNSSPANFALLDPTGASVLVSTTNESAVQDTASGRRICTLHDIDPHKAPLIGVRQAAFSPNGEVLLTIKAAGSVQTWNSATGNRLCEMEQVPGRPIGAAFSPDGSRIVVTGVDGTAVIWDITNSLPYRVLKGAHSGWVGTAAFSPDGKFVVTGGFDTTASVWDVANGKQVSSLKGHEGWITWTAFSTNGLIVTTSKDKTARIWNWQSTNSLATLEHRGEVLMASFNGDGSRVITASSDGTARIWNSTNGVPMTDPLRHDARVLTAAFSVNDGGKRALTTCADNTVHVWDSTTGEQLGEPLQLGSSNRLFTAGFLNVGDSKVVTASAVAVAVWNTKFNDPGELLPHAGKMVWSVRFSPDANRVVTACIDGTARVWDALATNHSKLLLSFKPTTAKPLAVRYAEYSPNGKLVVTASEDHLARIWDAASGGNPIRELRGHTNAVRFATFSRNSDRVVTASLDNTAIIWNLEDSPFSSNVLRHKGGVMSAVFSPDGTRVVTASLDTTAQIWDSARGTNVCQPLRHTDEVNYATFSKKDGRYVVTACSDGFARIWDAGTGKLQQTLTNSGKVVMAQFSPDDKMVVTACFDGTVRLWTNWNCADCRRLTVRHSDQVNSVEFSPDGRFVLSSSADGTARLWQLADGRMISYCEPFPHQGEVKQACFSPVMPNGSLLVATAGEDGTAGIWKVPPRATWGVSMTNTFKIHDNGTNGPDWTDGEVLTAAISGYHFDPLSGQLQQLSIDRRLKLKEVLDDTNRENDVWRHLFQWWEKSPESRPPWPGD
ncbi:MAG TPA: hypothetical protein VMR33_08085 [Candidatus Baltobacteraceae bacterium]|jgi:WD40 repeat protein|nr:hypothetical protein [Candidatus Baltobacteraceae bacterium]